MKRIVAAGSLFALALTAFAQSAAEQKVLIPASKDVHRIYTSPEDLARYKGAYDLSNGKTLYLVRRGSKLLAQVDEQSQHEIVRTGAGQFQALDGMMSMQLVFAPDDTVSGQLSYVDEAPIAGLVPQVTSIQFASR